MTAATATHAGSVVMERLQREYLSQYHGTAVKAKVLDAMLADEKLAGLTDNGRDRIRASLGAALRSLYPQDVVWLAVSHGVAPSWDEWLETRMERAG